MNMVKVPSSRFQQCFFLLPMLFVEGYSEAGFFIQLSNPLFRRRYFRKYIGSAGHLFFENVQNVTYIPKMKRKIEEKSFVS